MSWQGLFDCSDISPSDRVMMEEVLELLASESTSVSHERTSIATSNNKNDRRRAGELVQTESVATLNEVARESSEMKSLDDDNVTKKHLTEQQGHEDQAQLIQDLIPRSLMEFTATAPEPPRQSLSDSTQELVMATNKSVASTVVPISPPSSILLHRSLQDLQLPSKKECASATLVNSDSNVMSTGQRVHVNTAVEFEELRRKVQMQPASRRYRKRKKEAIRHEKMRRQELQIKLSGLQYIEEQTKQYEQCSVELLQEELKTHQDEVADLDKKLQEAARQELDWVTHLPSS